MTANALAVGTSSDAEELREDLRRSVVEGMKRFPLDYWMDHDRQHLFPFEFFDFCAAQGWIGLAIPPLYGGSGLGITEAAIMFEAIAGSGAGLGATSAIHINVFGTNVVVQHGDDEMKQTWLPKIAKGEIKVAFGITEPNSGLDTTSIQTRAVRKGDDWVVNGRKVWISTAKHADRILLLTRTSDRNPASRTKGMTLFFTDLDRSHIDVREIAKAGRGAIDSNELFIDDLLVPDSDRVGEVGDGFRLLLDGLNPERLLVAAEAIGMGRAAIRIASDYAKDRKVFGRPIGSNQGIQFPLAFLHAELEGAWQLVMQGADLYDRGLPCGPQANSAKLLGGFHGYAATDRAMQTLGGYGYASEYHVERLWRESKICRLAPVSEELICAYLAEHVLGLPRSY